VRLPAEGYAVRLYPLVEPDEVRLADLWRALWSGRWLILALSVICSVLALLASFVITPVYRAEVVMAPVTSDRNAGGLSSLVGQLGGLASLAGVNLSSGDDTAQSLAVLHSRSFTEKFLDRHALLPILYADLWNPETKTWDVDDPAETPTLWKAYDLFDKSVRTITQDATTGLVTLTIEWSDPKVATAWANQLVSDVNADVRNRAIEQSQSSIEFLRQQVQSTAEVELRTAVFGLMEAEMKNAMLAHVRTEYAFEVIDPAVVPEKRVWPNRVLLGVLGLAAGFFLGVLVVFLRRLFAAREPVAH
jgi:uncharacterized protein involved in exopolysaccharide biosynthesis